MKPFHLSTLLALVTAFILAVAAIAAVPSTINYQGYLKDSAGMPVSAPTSVRFSLYSSNPARNNPVWSETKSVTPSNGIYSTQLGSVTPITAPFDVPYWLGVKVEGDAEMALQPLASAPYAQRAKVTDSVPDSSITTTKLVDGAVTDAKVTGPVSGSKITSAGLNADTVDGLHAADFSRNAATDTSQANLLALIASLQAQINTLTNTAAASAAPSMGSDVIIKNTGEQRDAQVAIDPQGNAIAVWVQQDVDHGVWSSRYSAGAGWGTAVLMETNAFTPQVAMDAVGDAIAVWQQGGNVRSRPYSAGGGWGTALTINSGGGGVFDAPQVVMDAAGNATAVWSQSDATRYNIWANRYTVGTGWGAATLIETNNAGSASEPQVAMDGLGNAFAVWLQFDGTGTRLYGNRYQVGTGWGTAALLESDFTRNVETPRIAMDPSGNATLVWQMNIDAENRQYNIRTKRYSIGTGWGIATEMATATTSNHYPRVAMDVRGNALIVWGDNDGTDYNLWAKYFTVGTGWGVSRLLENNSFGFALNHQTAMDAMGNAIAVWQQSDGTRETIWLNRYAPGTGWGTAISIAKEGGSVPRVAMDAQGNAVVLYYGNDLTVHSIYLSATSWKASTLIETDNLGTALRPQVAMDSWGNAVAVWYQTDGVRYNIWANRYTIGGGWGTAALIETDSSGDASGPQVAMDTQGNAMAVWNQSDGTRDNIWANRYTQGAGWGAPVLIETDNAGLARAPQVAMDSFGNAIAVWYQADGVRNNIWSNRYTLGAGWGTAVLIETDNSGPATAPQVALDLIGNALAVWEQSDGTRYNIWANRYIAGVGWGTAVLIETGSGQAHSPQVAMDSLGNALAVWEQSDGIRSNIWANRYAAGIGWGTAVLIETDNTGDAGLPQVALDAQGNATVVWSQSDGTRDNIWVNRYAAGVGWGTAILLETNNAGSAGDAQVAMDPQGNALAVWGQNDGTRANIYGNWYTPGAGWGIPVLLETDNAGGTRFPQIAMIANGIATAVWQQSDGTRNNIWANRRQQLSP